MEAGRELDALVAEKVMGWKLENYETSEPASTDRHYLDASRNDGWAWVGRETDIEAWQWQPSTDIAAAWEVVEKLLPCQFTLGSPEKESAKGDVWYAEFGEWVDHLFQGEEATAPTAPHAICLAALKAMSPGG